jgi:hypothetical protein
MEPSTPSLPQPSAINFKTLRWGLLLLLLAVLTAAATVYGILQLNQHSTLALRQARVQHDEMHNRLARVNDEEREIRANIARYQELIARGRTQPERRLEWVETLRQIRDERRLLGLDYEIAPQRLLDEKIPLSGGFAFLTSPMKLELPLLHENDLLGLLADLSAQVHALISVTSCRIERITPDANQRFAANLKASCELNWITLQEKT